MNATLLLLIAGAIGLVILGTAVLKWHPALVLLVVSLLLGGAAGLGVADTLAAVNTGFGNLLGSIGWLVVLGALLGVLLEDSGAAARVAERLLRGFGAQHPERALASVGALVSIPVFCDSGFILLAGLARAVGRRARHAAGATAPLALAGGLYTTHTLVPPTPGPVAALGNLGAIEAIGQLMLLGLVVSLPVLLVVMLWSRRVGPRLHLTPLVAEPAAPPDRILPAFGRAVLPLLLPILLITAGTAGRLSGFYPAWLRLLGNPLIALLLGFTAAVVLLRGHVQHGLGALVKRGVSIAGPILIITGAGGALGGVLKALPLGAQIEALTGADQLGGPVAILLAFGLAALLKTAQGSSTNALVVTSALLAPLVVSMSATQLALLTLATGGGAMTVSHANDSFFWVVTEFSGLSVRDALRSFSVLTALQGTIVLLSCLGLWQLLA